MSDCLLPKGLAQVLWMDVLMDTGPKKLHLQYFTVRTVVSTFSSISKQDKEKANFLKKSNFSLNITETIR